jgi:hypothetical protein
MRRYTRLSNRFYRKIKNHAAAVAFNCLIAPNRERDRRIGLSGRYFRYTLGRTTYRCAGHAPSSFTQGIFAPEIERLDAVAGGSPWGGGGAGRNGNECESIPDTSADDGLGGNVSGQ